MQTFLGNELATVHCEITMTFIPAELVIKRWPPGDTLKPLF